MLGKSLNPQFGCISDMFTSAHENAQKGTKRRKADFFKNKAFNQHKYLLLSYNCFYKFKLP